MSVPPSSVATPRPSSLNVPATQNTAPVVKFRCLFTHDMRRKAKRWQDGFLRYHTFNKRVMVYDNTGYFIGDLHWRAPEGIQDGDELELDKGVLIQVCEPLEQTETDISALYKNKSQPSPSQPGNGPPSSMRSTPRPMASQQAPRSLNDLLGIKKGWTPQLFSPFEQRNGQRPPSSYQPQERPAKRQRTSPERDSPSEQDFIDIDVFDSPSSSQQHAATDTSPNPISWRQNQSTTALPGQRPSKDSSTASNLQAPSNRPVQPAARVEEARNPPSRPQNQPMTALPDQRTQTDPPTASRLQAPSSRPSQPSGQQNLISAPPPNPSLRAPGQPMTAVPGQRPPNNSSTASRPQAQPSRPVQPNPHIQKPASTSESSSNNLRLASSKPRTKLMYQERAAPIKREPTSQISRTISQSRPAVKPEITSSQVIVIDDDDPRQQAPMPRPVRADLTRSVSMMDTTDDTNGRTPPIKNSPGDQFPHVSNASIPLPQPEAPIGKQNQPPTNAPRPRSTGLRKSFSDPTTINIPTRPLPTSPLNPITETNDDQGPWTSEALDLFDFWPPGRPKPV